jgi:1,2-diacylglycerol 3-beta-galactosyltransferase
VPERAKLDFVFFDAGGGHRAAVTALKQVVERQGRPWDVRLVNLQEVLDSLDVFRRITGLRLEDIYNTLLRKGWTLGSGQLLGAMQRVIRLYHRAQVRLLADFWRQAPPDLVVSLVPNFNRALFEGLRGAGAAAPFVTVLTDLADYPPHFWMEPQPQHFICGTDKAVEQALAMDHPRERVFRVSGMILRPRFYEPVEVDRAAERVKLGLAPGLPTGLVLFGGHGSRAMIEIARRVARCSRPAQFIFVCGHNQGLVRALEAERLPYPKVVEGYTTGVYYYMKLADFFIGKPGPGSISEALLMRLPVIIERNAWTLPQERYNAEWVRERQVGFVLDSFRNVHQTVDQLLEPATLAGLEANVAALDNRAVFEIPEILERLLSS